MSRVTRIQFHPCRREDRASGLRGWASCVYSDALVLDSIAVRQSADRRLLISFPLRVDGNGVEHPFVKPLTPAVRAEIENAIVEHVRRGGWAT